ncbi:MAG: molybdopterin-guanine dinucleotide biosynthesis protein B [Synergistaceae bacterium]|nr:molybdopterin-guanine dinucleotide biosynthesis protein B [Synergistaceae bacterium]
MFNDSVPPVLSVVGYSDSGKTTYLEKLIPALKKRGIKLCVIKHDAHSFDMDMPGKDSWRLTQAGADITVVSSPAKIAVIEKWEHEENLSALALRFRGKADLILTEGYKRDSALKIEIRRAANKALDPFCKDEELFAVAGDYDLETEAKTSVPLLPLDDAAPMADLIMSFLKEKGFK